MMAPVNRDDAPVSLNLAAQGSRESLEQSRNRLFSSPNLTPDSKPFGHSMRSYIEELEALRVGRGPKQDKKTNLLKKDSV